MVRCAAICRDTASMQALHMLCFYWHVGSPSYSHSMRLMHAQEWLNPHQNRWWVGAFVAPASNYCARANTLAAYADVNR